MSEKRFTMYKNDHTLIDNLTGHICEFPNQKYAETCCKWLNELWEENEQLEKGKMEALSLLGEEIDKNEQLKKENEQLKNELRKEKSLREYSDSMYGADLIVDIRFSNGEWKADVSVIDDE